MARAPLLWWCLAGATLWSSVAAATVCSVTTFGAKGDNHTDDTASIQAALNEANCGVCELIERSVLWLVLAADDRSCVSGRGCCTDIVVFPSGGAYVSKSLSLEHC